MKCVRRINQHARGTMFLPHFDVLCDLLLNRRTATWNIFVLHNKETTKVQIKFFI